MNELTSALPGPVHAFDAPARGAPAPAAPAPLAGRTGSGTRPGPKPPRSDLGTVILHWTVAASVFASLLTGLRISADAPTAVVSRFLAPILPQVEVWTVHFVASLALFFVASAYVLYLVRGGLARRVNLKKARVFTLPTAARLRWAAANVVLYWAFYGLTVTLTGTGIALYLGYGGPVVAVHAFCAITMLGYIAVHLVCHFGYGGWQQWLRLFRPSRLVANRATRRLPLVVAGLVGLPVAAGLAGLDLATRGTLTVNEVETPPTLDGVLDDAAWKAARPVFVRTMQGANLGGTGESTVEIRAVHDGRKIYFAFRWEDPTRSLFRLPLIKHADGWHLHATKAGSADVVDFYEDKFAVLFSPHDGFGAAGATHMGPRPVADRPSSLNERGLHYTSDGGYLDMWQWKASSGGMLGHMDDQYMGPIRDATPDDAAKRARYQGGYWNDPGTSFYGYNFPFEGPGGYAGPIRPKRLPGDYAAVRAAMGTFDPADPDMSADEGAKTWLLEGESVPYSAEADAGIPVGAVIPGVLIMGEYTGDRADVRCGARWQDGHWTLETSRDLATGSRYDVDFVKGTPLFMWVSVFDHTQTRHTRHVRPVRIEIR